MLRQELTFAPNCDGELILYDNHSGFINVDSTELTGHHPKANVQLQIKFMVFV